MRVKPKTEKSIGIAALTPNHCTRPTPYEWQTDRFIWIASGQAIRKHFLVYTFGSVYTTVSVGWLDDRHDLSPILYDTAPLFVYTDQLMCHCVSTCYNVR